MYFSLTLRVITEIMTWMSHYECCMCYIAEIYTSLMSKTDYMIIIGISSKYSMAACVAMALLSSIIIIMIVAVSCYCCVVLVTYNTLSHIYNYIIQCPCSCL